MRKLFSLKKSLYGYRSRSTDFTSLSSLLIYLFAISRQIIAINGKNGSIPFSGNWIPPDKLSSQYSSIPINKAFMIMLMVFSRICLFLLLKLNMLSTPVSTRTTQAASIAGKLPVRSTSWPVMNRNTAASTARKVHMVCILCSMKYKFHAKVA